MGGVVARTPGLAAVVVEVGGGILEDEARAEDLAHRAAVLASAGRYAEAFGPDYLAELRGLACMIAIDASVRIVHLNSADSHRQAATEVLLSSSPGQMLIHTLKLTKSAGRRRSDTAGVSMRDDPYA